LGEEIILLVEAAGMTMNWRGSGFLFFWVKTMFFAALQEENDRDPL